MAASQASFDQLRIDTAANQASIAQLRAGSHVWTDVAAAANPQTSIANPRAAQAQASAADANAKTAAPANAETALANVTASTTLAPAAALGARLETGASAAAREPRRAPTAVPRHAPPVPGALARATEARLPRWGRRGRTVHTFTLQSAARAAAEATKLRIQRDQTADREADTRTHRRQSYSNTRGD
jgi:hypothetical protein